MRLIKWCVMVCVVAVLAVGGAILVGRGQPTPALITALHLEQCELPCWIGIVPRKTTWKDAKQIIRKVYSESMYAVEMLDASRISITLKGTSESVEVNVATAPLGDENAPISALLLTIAGVAADNQRVGDIVWRLGIPEDVILASSLENPPHPIARFRDKIVLLSPEEVLSCGTVPFYVRHYSILLIGKDTKMLWTSMPEHWRGFGYCYRFQPASE